MPENGRERRRFIETATQVLDRAMTPLWDLGANSLVGWQPTTGGLDVLLVP